MQDQSPTTIETDVLIIGAGPAGLGLASFLGSYGIKGIVVSKMNSTVKTPRAHYTNPATLECLRDIDLEDVFMRTGVPEADLAENLRFGDTFAGDEYIRSMAFSNDPHRQGDYWEASPCKYLDIPQTEAEPLLLRYATHKGWQARFNTEFESFEQAEDDDEDDGFVLTTVRDVATNQQLRIKSKYLAGADGARSKVADQLGLSFESKDSFGLALNIHFKADLEQDMKGRLGLLHGALLNSMERPPFAMSAINRVIKPFKEWLMILFCAPGATIEATQDEIVAHVKDAIGHDVPDFELLSISQWRVNEEYADRDLSKGRVFCLGDAIHRHPPNAGFGSNTCIQDGYNLAWKLAYVLRGQASPALLSSYTAERQPVAQQIVTHANDFLRADLELWKLLGALEPTPAARMAKITELRSATGPAARARRRALLAAQDNARAEHQCLGSEFNQTYASGAICARGEAHVPSPRDTRLYYDEGTLPGRRLPHAWLSADRAAHRISSHDLAGHGAFALFTGVGGRGVWGAAAEGAMRAARAWAVPGAPQVRVNVFCIGMGQEYEDLYWMWERKRGVEETGAVLARPDRFVGWRWHEADDVEAEELGRELADALRSILGFASGSELPVR